MKLSDKVEKARQRANYTSEFKPTEGYNYYKSQEKSRKGKESD